MDLKFYTVIKSRVFQQSTDTSQYLRIDPNFALALIALNPISI